MFHRGDVGDDGRSAEVVEGSGFGGVGDTSNDGGEGAQHPEPVALAERHGAHAGRDQVGGEGLEIGGDDLGAGEAVGGGGEPDGVLAGATG